jgi:type I restriction enzyme R subunit
MNLAFSMTPEEKARRDIDRQLAECGWQVQSRDEMNISAALGVAVREFVMTTGEADYLLYAGGKAIGVIEAKPAGHPLISVEAQMPIRLHRREHSMTRRPLRKAR